MLSSWAGWGWALERRRGLRSGVVMRRRGWMGMIALGALLGLAACGPERSGGDDDENNAAANNAAANNATPAPRELCSLAAPTGECPSGYGCLDGACVGLGLFCSAALPAGECAFGSRCVDGACFEEAQLCGAQNPIGVCPESQFCNEGFCTTREPCGPGEPSGSCGPGEVCFMGACTAREAVCGPFNTERGACLPGLVCLEGACHLEAALCSLEERGGRCPPGEACSGGECLPIGEACSLVNPAGACANGFDCFEGFCRDEAELCSPANPSGFCALGRSCIAGECREQTQSCSTTVFDGLCPEGLTCSAGQCVGPVACGADFPHGVCADGETCLCNVGTGLSFCSSDQLPGDASGDQRRALDRANALRNSVGLWSLRMDARINAATSAHADYLVYEANEAHDQTRTDSPYYTGAKFWDRLEAAGYTGAPFSEVIAYSGDPVAAVDGLVATVYHREPFFDPYALELGYGGATGPNGSADVINFGAAPSSCVDPILVVYPPNGATAVDVSWDGLESPLPPPPPGGYPSGPVISVHGTDALQIETHRILLGDAELEHTHLTAQNDPNGSIGQNHYFLYPHKPLRAGTEYIVEVTGTHGASPFHLRWSFRTK